MYIAPFGSYCYAILKSGYCLRCRTFLPLNKLEFDFLALRKGVKSFALNGAVVDKYVCPVSAFDETKAFSIVEPFDGSGLAVCHEITILL